MRRADGGFVRLGRLEEQCHARGFRLDLSRTETALCALPGIRHAIVRPCRGPESAETVLLVAYLWLQDPSVPLAAEAQLRRLLHESGLPDELLPAAFLRQETVPIRAADGRLDLAALPAAPENLPARFADASRQVVRPYLALQHQIIALWEELLDVHGIGIRDDFFDLGGNSLLAMRMLHRIEQVCGKVILPATLFTGATVEHLADEIARQAAEEAPTVLKVNESGSRTPFFYLHGDLSGGGFYSRKLSRALGVDQPFYALPPHDVRALPAAPSIEEMAAEHLRTIRAVRPHGPYVIGGFCIGGLVAYELARQIEASGDSVEMLLVIDASADDRTLRGLQWLALTLGRAFGWDDDRKAARFGRWIVVHARLAQWFRLRPWAQLQVAARRLGNRAARAGGRLRKVFQWRRGRTAELAAETPTGATGAGTGDARDVPTAFLWATASYRAQSYDGAMALLLSSDLLEGSANLAQAWKRVTPAVTVHPLAGSHLECITAHIDILAETMQSCLEAVAEQQPRPRRQPRRNAALVPADPMLGQEPAR